MILGKYVFSKVEYTFKTPSLIYHMKLSAIQLIYSLQFTISAFCNTFQPDYGLRVDLASNKNEYQECSWGVKCSRHLRLTTSLSSVSQMSIKFGILNVSQPYRPPRPISWTVSLERWETKIANTEVTPQAIWPIAKSLMKKDGPKAPTAIHGPFGLTFHPSKKANTTADCLEIQFTPHDLCDENH
jgi:hypothetical protein